MIECHIFLSISHDIILGFDWLCTCNTHIDFWACILSVQVPGGHCLLDGLPCDSIAHIELASFDSVLKEIDHSAVAWYTIICLVEPLNAIGACGTLAGG